MFEHLADLEVELEQLESQLSAIYSSGDQAAARDAGRRHAELKPVVEAFALYRAAESDLADARELVETEGDVAAREQWRAEAEYLETKIADLATKISELLIPSDPNDGKNVIVEIRGAVGGDEANIWAGDLFRMYQRYAEEHGWKIEILSSQPADLGGFRDLTFVVKGADAWSRMKYEAGPHRVQRVPATESQGRVHTSAATVAVLPEAEEVDVALDPNDLEFDVYRSSGPGGQSVNTTDSAVRITHKPSGLVVTCQDEKSQLQNKEKGLRILRSRLLQMEHDRRNNELSAARREQVKSGDRSDKIRTYNYKDSRVTDHRIGLTVHGLSQVLEGQLDEIVDALAAAERTEQLSASDA